MRQYTLGCDPEFFVERDSQVISAHPLVKGTKTNPEPVPGGAVQVDGTALEFNIYPAHTEDEWTNTIYQVMDHIRDSVLSPAHLSMLPASAVTFSSEEWDRVPDFARVLGCDPDWNAWQMIMNSMAPPPKRFRTAAGHVHIGWTQDKDINDPDYQYECGALVRHLDATLGLSSVIMDAQGGPRRKLYGSAGAFRPKSYGLEYRVLSNFWIFSEDHIRWVWRATQRALEMYDNGQAVPPDQVYADIINRGDAEAAREVLPEPMKELICA